MEMLKLAGDETRVGTRHPGGPVFLPMDQLAHPRRPRADVYQACQC